MKQYVTLILILFLTSTAFSQKSTEKTLYKSEDSVICISKNVAKQIVKDLYRVDSLKAELHTSAENYKILESNLSLKDTIISNKNTVIDYYKEREKNYVEIISIKDKQLQQYSDLSSKLQSDLKKSKKRVSLGISATTISLLLAVGSSLLR